MLITLLFFSCVMLFLPANAQAQTYNWYPGFDGFGANCQNVGHGNNSAICASPAAACQSIAGEYSSTFQTLGYSLLGPVCNYEYLTTPFSAQLASLCTGTVVGDGYTPQGCSPPGQVMAGKSIGSGGIGGKQSHDMNPSPSVGDCSMCPGSSDVSTTGQASQGEPVDIGSGNMFYSVTDYSTVGQNQLSFSRYYNSRSNFATVLGVQWKHTYDRYVLLYSSSLVMVERADGQMLPFTLVSGVWTPETDVDYRLTNSGTTWTLTDPNDYVETYTVASGATQGYLNSIVARGGYTQTLSYNSSNQLTSVTDSYSRALTFTYISGTGLLSTLSTPDGMTVTYGYTSTTSGSNLTSASYPGSPAQTITYLYGDTILINALTGVQDENGNRVATWSYDAFSRCLSSYLGGSGLSANSTTFNYNDTTGVHTVTNALGVVDSYSFTTVQNIPKISSISRAATSTTAAATRSFHYDSNGYLDSETDWNTNSTTYVNDARGQRTSITEAASTSLARTTTIAYDTTTPNTTYPYHLVTSFNPPRLSSGFTYDANGNKLTRVDLDNSSAPTHGQTRTYTYTYDATGHQLTAETPNSNTTTYTYDSSGALTDITNAKSQQTQITSHTAGGRPLTVVDPNGVTTTLTYDARQRLLTSAVSTSAGTRTTTNTYDAAGELTKVTQPDNSYLSFTYDNAHRKTSVTDLYGDHINFTLDALGDVTQTQWFYASGAAQRTHSATFDALGRMLTDVGGMSQTTTLAYDSMGNVVSIQDPRSHTTTQVFDALNRKTSLTDANSGTIGIVYSTQDIPLTYTDPKGYQTYYTYSAFGDRLKSTSQDSGVWNFTYDADSNLTQMTDAASVVTNHTYDALDRVLTDSYPADSAENVAYTYDQTTGHTFGIGLLTSLTDAAGSLSHNYDERHNLLSEARTNGTTTYTTYYTYDPASRMNSTTYPSGWTVNFTRNLVGQMKTIGTAVHGSTPAQNIATPINHIPFGPPRSIAAFNGETSTFTFDADYRLTNITAATTGSTLQNLSYGYDATDNVTGITDAVNSADSQTLVYDVINRLTSATSGTGGYGSLSFAYDKTGNLTTQGSASYGYASSTNRLNSITVGTSSTSLAYTANGNISSVTPSGGTAETFTYNKANRLVSNTGTALVMSNAVYDAFGKRFSKTDPSSSPTLFFYGQDGILIEEIDNGVATDYINLDGGTPLATLSPATGTLYYVHNDRLGTPQLLTNSSAASVWSATYQPYGNASTSGSATQGLRLPGQYADVETGFHYNGARDYMPGLGRYLEADPIGLAGGINPYLYANGNPIAFTDRSGLIVPLVVWKVVGGASIGLVSGFTAGYAAGGMKGGVVGGGLGIIIGGLYTPTAAALVATRVGAWLGSETAGAIVASTPVVGAASGLAGTVATNLWKGDSLAKGTIQGTLIGLAAPILSLEAFLPEATELAGRYFMSANSGIVGSVLSFADTQLERSSKCQWGGTMAGATLGAASLIQ